MRHQVTDVRGTLAAPVVAAAQPVEEIMHSPLVTVEATLSLRALIATLCRGGVGAVLIVDGEGTPIGIVSERDVVRMIDAGVDIDDMCVADAIGQSVFWVVPHDSIAHAGRLMIELGVRHLPVLRDGLPIGMVSIRDVLKALLDPAWEDAARLAARTAGRR